jgi:hypothetical protein
MGLTVGDMSAANEADDALIAAAMRKTLFFNL